MRLWIEKASDCRYWPFLQHDIFTTYWSDRKVPEQRESNVTSATQHGSTSFNALILLSIFIKQRHKSRAVLQSRLSQQHLWCAGVCKLLTCVHGSVSRCVDCGGLASAQPHTLLLVHVSTHKEGFKLPFTLDVDKASTFTWVPQLRQHGRCFLCNLEVHTHNFFKCTTTAKKSLIHTSSVLFYFACLLNSFRLKSWNERNGPPKINFPLHYDNVTLQLY